VPPPAGAASVQRCEAPAVYRALPPAKPTVYVGRVTIASFGSRRSARAVLAGSALVVLLAASPAAALTLLTTGKTATFTSGKSTKAVVRAGLDGAALPLRDPRCPAESTIVISLARHPDVFEGRDEIALPCAQWKAHRGGYRFEGTEADGGIRTVVYGPKRLVVKASGTGFAPVVGPVAYVQAWLTIGGERFLVRFHDFKKNETTRVVARKPTKHGAAGEAAFFDTIWGDAPRDAETEELLEKAIQKRDDGRAEFLLGMLHLWRSAVAEGDIPSRLALADFAQPHLDRAVELLPEDARIPGFRAAVTYSRGLVHGDQALIDQGLQQIDAAIETNRLFNAFDLFAIAPVLPQAPSSDFYQNRLLGLVDYITETTDCLTDWPEVCGNTGMAPHNLEGTLMLFADLYAKGGRLQQARQWYTIARSFAVQNGASYLDELDERIATVDARVAAYGDGDPSNDPALMDGGIGFCPYCHAK